MSKPNYIILFVDDEPWLSQPLRLALEASDFRCVSKTNMSEAWTFLDQNNVSVLVTDIMMPAGPLFPDVDSSNAGYDLVKRVRSRFPLLAVICLSVIGDVEKIEELKRKGVLYLRKGETPLDTAKRLIESKATGKISF